MARGPVVEADRGGAQPVLLALGANLGDPPAALAEALRRLSAFLTLERVSSLYRTEPVGYAEQPDFFNLVVSGTTSLEPLALLHGLQAVEHALGRTRPFPNAPRTLDIDLLAYGELRLRTPELTLPHPRLHQRGFVLVPLTEVAPQWRHPRLGQTPAGLLAQLPAVERVERAGRLPGW